MTKWGLAFEFIGFIMLFWQSYVRPNRTIENGGGSTTERISGEIQIEKALKWIPNQTLRRSLARFWQTIAFGFIVVGVIFQLLA